MVVEAEKDDEVVVVVMVMAVMAEVEGGSSPR